MDNLFKPGDWALVVNHPYQPVLGTGVQLNYLQSLGEQMWVAVGRDIEILAKDSWLIPLYRLPRGVGFTSRLPR